MVVGRCSFGWSCGGDEWRWAVSGEELLGFLVVNGERNTERDWMREEGWGSSTKWHSFRLCVIWAIWAGQGTCGPVFTIRARPFKFDWTRFHHPVNPLGRLNPPNSFFSGFCGLGWVAGICPALIVYIQFCKQSFIGFLYCIVAISREKMSYIKIWIISFFFSWLCMH